MSWLVSLLMRLVSGGLLDQVHKILASGDETERTRLVEAARVEIARREAQRDVVRAWSDHPTFWVAWGLFAIPLGLWWAAIVLDSMLPISLDIGELGSPAARLYLNAWAETIIYALFGSGTALGVSGQIAAALSRPRR